MLNYNQEEDCGCSTIHETCGCNDNFNPNYYDGNGYGGGNHDKGTPVFTGSGGEQGPTTPQDGPTKEGISIPPLDTENIDYTGASSGNIFNNNVGDNLVNPLNEIITIGGYVQDELGTPLLGASVYEGGNDTNGVASDNNGFFTLQVKRGSTVYVSFTGTTTEAFLASEFPDIITLKSESLDEVVINVPKKKINYLGWGLGIGLLILGMRIFAEDNPENTPRSARKPIAKKRSRTVKATL